MPTALRYLTGIGGHAGKQHEFIVHVGLGEAESAKRIEVRWPQAAGPSPTVLENVVPGRHQIRMSPSSE